MLDYLLALALLLAVAAGWWLNIAFQRFFPERGRAAPVLARHFLKNINSLFQNQPDQAINSFIAAVPVNKDTLEIYLALGKLMRQRGEFDRAIRLHQNLVGSQMLNRQQNRQAQMELAKDCLKAGLLDRAERLLLELVEEDDEFRTEAVHRLVKIYQHEKEWEKALHICAILTEDAAAALTIDRAHFYCELAEAAMVHGDLDRARRQLELALAQQPATARAFILLGGIEEGCGDFSRAIDYYVKIGQHCPNYIPEVVEALQRCYEQAGRGDQVLLELFMEWMEIHPGTTLLLGILALQRRLYGEQQGLDYLSEQLKRHPSLRGMQALLTLHQKNAISIEQQELAALNGLLGALIRHRPGHQCAACGFKAKQLHWLCPQCKQWGTILPVKGIEGE